MKCTIGFPGKNTHGGCWRFCAKRVWGFPATEKGKKDEIQEIRGFYVKFQRVKNVGETFIPMLGFPTLAQEHH
jgi:hypothetical protein